MHLNYDNMHKNGMFYALIYINNHVIINISYMLSSACVYFLYFDSCTLFL